MATCPERRKEYPDDVANCPEHGLALLPAAIFANEDRELEVGAPVGDYVVEAKLGEGSFGRVYRATHPIIGRRVAIKVLNRALSTDPHAVSRFVAEARAIVEVASPNIVDVYSLGALPDGRQYYIMELLDGLSLDRFLAERGPLELPEALRVLSGMANALAAAHQAGVVHRDLKPENVLIVFDQQGGPWPKLLDFGVAKLLGDRKLGYRTSTGALVGTPSYMAPEQAFGLDVDRRADIYAFGIVAFEMLAGRPPFEATSLLELVRKHATEPPPRLSELRSGLGDAFDDALCSLLAKDPEDRPETIGEAFAALRAAAQKAGHDVSLPAFLSLRPPTATPSAPSATSRPSTSSARKGASFIRGDAPTVPVAQRTAPMVPRAVTTVDGTSDDARDAARAAKPRPRLRPWWFAVGALGLAALALAIGRLRADAPVGQPGPAPSDREHTAAVDTGLDRAASSPSVADAATVSSGASATAAEPSVAARGSSSTAGASASERPDPAPLASSKAGTRAVASTAASSSATPPPTPGKDSVEAPSWAK